MENNSKTPEYKLADKFLLFMQKKRIFSCGNYNFRYIDLSEGAYILVINVKNSRTWNISGLQNMRDLIDDEDLPLRICDACGSPMDKGYTDECGTTYFCCDEEFTADMDRRYGKGNWHPEPTGDFEWCYEYRTDEKSPWEPEPSFYTTWE